MADLEEKKDVTPVADKKDKDKKVAPLTPKKVKVPFREKIGKFIRDYKSELKKIVWSTPKQVLHNTILVLVSIVVVSAFIGVLDYAFSTGVMALGRLI